MKLTGIGEQFDSGRLVTVDRSAAHVVLSVEADTDSRVGVALLTPAQARAVAGMLTTAADLADKIEMGSTQ